MKRLYRYTASVLAAAFCLSAVLSFPSFAAVEERNLTPEDRYYMDIQSNSWENWPAGPQVYAESAIVMEASTGTILYAKNIDDQHYPASITKIMTVLLALENCDLDEEVVFSHNAVYSIDYASSHIARDEGEILTVEECLYAILLESANECSNAIAEHIAGTTEAFAEMMNERAAELGCTNTHFANPHGLPDENHYTSAHDMALILQEVVKHETFRRISGSANYTLRATNLKDEELLMNNHHYMISAYKTSRFLDDTVFAGKTGYTTVALNTLVTCATRNGMDLLCVTMKTQGSGEQGVPLYTDTANLLDYAGQNFQKINISQNETNFTINQNELFSTGSSFFENTTPMIELDDSGYVVLPAGMDFSAASPQLEFVDGDDEVIATLTYSFAGQEVGSTDLLMTGTDIQEFNFQKIDDGEEGEEQSAAAGENDAQVRLVKINLRIVGVVAAVIILLIVLILILRKFSGNFSVEWNFIRKWRRKRSARNAFGNQNRIRYRSRKRRRKFNWKFWEK